MDTGYIECKSTTTTTNTTTTATIINNNINDDKMTYKEYRKKTSNLPRVKANTQ